MARTKKAASGGKTKSGDRIPSADAYKKFKKERNEELKKESDMAGKDRMAQINKEWKTHEDNPNRTQESD